MLPLNKLMLIGILFFNYLDLVSAEDLISIK